MEQSESHTLEQQKSEQYTLDQELPTQQEKNREKLKELLGGENFEKMIKKAGEDINNRDETMLEKALKTNYKIFRYIKHPSEKIYAIYLKEKNKNITATNFLN